MHLHEYITQVYEYQLDELLPEEKALVYKSREAVQNAYSPYSKFSVGAAVQLENEQIVLGNNQENAAYPSGLCAERVAIFYANANFPNVPVKAIAISAFTKNGLLIEPVPPCGACRQVLLEAETRFSKPIIVYLAGKNKILRINNIKSLLPLTFNDDFLK